MPIQIQNDKITLKIVVVPKSSKDEIVGIHGGEIKITIKAPPVDGKANEYICKYLSKAFKTAKSNIEITKGQTNKHKTVVINKYSQIPEEIQQLAK